MRACALIAFLSALLLALPARAERGYDAGFIDGVGDATSLWLVVRALDERPRPYTLFFAPESLEPGSLRLVRGLTLAPSLMATTSDGLICVFPGRTEAEEGATPARPLRAFRLRDTPAGVQRVLAPEALAPLNMAGTPVALAEQQGALHVLVRTDDTYELYRLEGNEWEHTDLPDDPRFGAGGATLTLEPDATRVSVLEQRSLSATLWRRGEDGWTREMIALPAETSRLVSVGGRRVALRRVEAGFIVHPLDGATEPFLVDPVPENAFAGVFRNTVVFAWPEGEGSMKVRLRAVTLDRVEVFDDHVEMRGPVSPSDVQTLALMMGALCAIVLVFVVRQGDDREPVLSDDIVLATPLRRGLGWLIDLAPGMLASVLIWPELLEMPQGVFMSSGPGGPWPLALIVGQLVVCGTLGDAYFGRSLGKAVLGMRTIRYDGGPPTLWQAFSRNVVRGLIPPVALFNVINPGLPQPAGFQTLVVIARGG